VSGSRSLPALVGLRRATRQPRLALLLWGAQLALAAMVALPFRNALAGAIGDRPLPELLARPSFGFLGDLLRESDGVFELIGPLAGTAAILALLLNALLAGGALEALLASDPRPLGHRFGRGAGRFAGRMLRVGAAAGAAAILLALVGALPFVAAATKLSGAGREVGAVLLAMTGAALGLLLALAALLALDLARVRIVRDDRRDTMRALAGGAASMIRHPARVLGAWAAIAATFAVLLLVHRLVSSWLPTASAWAILLLALVQQVVMIVRAGLRVALWGAEIEIAARLDTRP